MNHKTPDCLIPAIRQFRHGADNSPSVSSPREGFVIAYDSKITESVVIRLEAEVERLRREIIHVLRHPSLMGFSGPAPGFWVALDHLRLLAKGCAQEES